MSTKSTRVWLHIPRTFIGVHIFRDCIDQRTYVGIGTWRHEAIIQVPRFWKRYSKRGRSPARCPSCPHGRDSHGPFGCTGLFCGCERTWIGAGWP